MSLLLFFFPLLTLHVPIAGDQEVSGYDVMSKLNEFGERLKPSDATPSSAPNTGIPGSRALQDLPLSMQLAWFIPLALVIAFLSAAVVLIAAFKNVRIARTASTIGACCSAAAILHTTIMNSDIHSWLSKSMKTEHADLKYNRFAGLAENLGTLIANAFQVKPGWGLYVLLVLLGATTVLGYSHVLSRLRVMPSPNC